MDTLFSVFIGLAVGYMVGMRDGPEGFAKLRDAWKTIMSSEEAKAVRASGPGMLTMMIKKGISMIAGPLTKD